MRKTIIIAAALALAGGCAGPQLEVRNRAGALDPAQGWTAQGDAQLALGNVGLALEAYRKGLAVAPGDLSARLGVARCYDRMGRFDLSRRHYELALAIDPGNPSLFAALAQSYAAQGRPADAAAVRREWAERANARAVAALTASGSVAELAMTTPDPAALPARAPLPPRATPAGTGRGARLERLSLGEVALRTRPGGEPAAIRTAQAARPAPAMAALLIVNAARRQGLAARTQRHLAPLAPPAVRLANAPAVRAQSLILYPAGQRAAAQQLARRLAYAIPLRIQPGAAQGPITVLLGRDAAQGPAWRG